MGLLLFRLLINDIDTNLRTCEITLYADDSVLYVTGKRWEEIEKNLSSELKQIASWLVKNNLVINLEKSKTDCFLYDTHQKPSESKPMDIYHEPSKNNGIRCIQIPRGKDGQKFDIH